VINLKSTKQSGNFTVEFSIVAIFFSLQLVFSGDVIIKLSVKGKLDRLSFSLVNVLKERTQLYSESYQIKQSEAAALKKIAVNSLKRTYGNFKGENFGFLVEEQTFSDIAAPNALSKFNLGAQRCAVAKSLGQLQHLSVVTTWNRQATLYRVTLCYETDNWIGGLLGKEFTTVSSSSVMIGR